MQDNHHVNPGQGVNIKCNKTRYRQIWYKIKDGYIFYQRTVPTVSNILYSLQKKFNWKKSMIKKTFCCLEICTVLQLNCLLELN